MPEVIDDGAGILLPAEQPEALAEALSDLLLDGERRCLLGTAARRSALARSWETTAEQFERVLSSA